MDLTAANAGFVIGAYGLSIIVLGGLAAYILVRDRVSRAEAEHRKEP
ncbi:MAG: heme exporter protein CcmD [Aestuariivirga sp.]